MRIDIDAAIIGGGPAGMAAALEAEKNGASGILILERDAALGGILRQCIHEGFGLHYFGKELTGPEYADRFAQEVLRSEKIQVKYDTMVLELTPGENGAAHTLIAVNKQDGVLEIHARAVILAMGCRERPRGALNIAGTRPSGVLSAGTAQKFVNLDGLMPGKEVVILGSGDVGLIMARRMTLEGAHVKMVCELMPYSSGLTRNIVQCLDDYGIPLRLSTTVVEVHGRERLEGVTIAQADETRRPVAGTEEYIPCDLLLLSVGLIPENELTRGAGLQTDPITGGPAVKENRETEIPGIFACGNVLHVHDLADYVTLESQIAGRAAAAYLRETARSAQQPQIPARGANGVRYVVPQAVRKDTEEPVKLYFRVGQVYKNAFVRLCAGDEILAQKRCPRLTPGEMEEIILKPAQLASLPADATLTVEVAV
jgi:NADPH-dependent 2,4-dienoyl-CoA reductase/sulfur reductase-like enzyme